MSDENTPFVNVLLCWRNWKATHDRADAKNNCCENTRALFQSLDEMERVMTGGASAVKEEKPS